MYPYNFARPQSKITGLIKGINFSNLLDGCQKTLGVINQAIPIVHQVGTMITNAKTMFKIANVINMPDENQRNINSNTTSNYSNISENKPIFYI